MAAKTKIEWTDNTFNPWVGCTKISTACDNCYAADIASRFKMAEWGAGRQRVKTSAANWKNPLQWNAQAKKQGKPIKVFTGSMCDIFDNEVPQDWRAELWDLIESTPYLTWQIVTKRIGNAHDMVPIAWLRNGFPKNVWLLITVSNQEEADRDIPKLLQFDAAVRGLSIEPMLGAIDLWKAGWHLSGENVDIDWVIVGGESGHKARPMHPDWVRSLRDQCQTEGVPFFFKQWGEWVDARCIDANIKLPSAKWKWIDSNGKPDKLTGAFKNENAHHVLMANVGKKSAGNLLDGQQYLQFPKNYTEV